jgi:hypothetical protein
MRFQRSRTICGVGLSDGQGRMANMRGEAEQVTYVLTLKVRFGRGCNFMKSLG